MADLYKTPAVMLIKSEEGVGLSAGRVQDDVIDTVVSVKDEVCYSQLIQGLFSMPSGCCPDNKHDTLVQTQNDTVNTVEDVTIDASQDMCLLPHTTLIRLNYPTRDLNDREIISKAIVCQNQMLSTEVSNEIFGVEKVPINEFSLDQNETLSKVLGTVKIEVLEQSHISLAGDGTVRRADLDSQVIRLKQEPSDDMITGDLDHIVLIERKKMLLTRSVLEKEKSITEIVLHANPDGNRNSTLSSSVKVKDEVIENSDFHSVDNNSVEQFSLNKVLMVKSEWETPDRLYRDDEIDHMPLKDRIKLLTSGENSYSVFHRDYECYNNTERSHLESDPVFMESIKPITIKRLRKRKKTATDSVETALDEDAPGLLQVLIDKGISVDEIRLYGEPESDDALDDSTDDFAELEAVISKIFFKIKRQSLLKLAPIRCTKDSKISYCLACLISLVEQTRYLHFRKWPVEWGWCRDLQSFIFVFQRHNRIVLERPEYGYATYFFELINSLPIDWQIKRLVTAMKLTNCSRINLIENKTLKVGEDLTEGEANVLAGYGWIQDTGLGSMLNYRDRVFHDRNSIKDSSEWRSKIGKLLMDGYDGGTIVLTDVPKKAMECRGTLIPYIKSEL